MPGEFGDDPNRYTTAKSRKNYAGISPTDRLRSGVIRTVASTGGVITAAGLIFAASMSGLLFSSLGNVVQGALIVGTERLLDTFLVRTVTVPAIAVLVG